MRKKKLKRFVRIRLILKLGTLCGLVALIGIGVVLGVYSLMAKNYDLKKLGTMPRSSVVFDCHGNEIGKLHGTGARFVPIHQVSQHFVNALLIREDARFYDHGGIDPTGVLRAAYRNIFKNKREGASTITMQLARNSFKELMSQKTLHRKLIEVMLARRIENNYTKEQILEFYVNRIFFGSGIYGVEMASLSYFGKRASEMTLSESAMLAGIIRGPNRFSPFRHYDDANSERKIVLKRMLSEGAIQDKDFKTAMTQRVRVLKQRPVQKKSINSYALDAIRRDLDDALSESNVEDGGLKIYTSIDLRLQRVAERAIEEGLLSIEKWPGYRHQTKKQFELRGAKGTPNYLQGAAVLLNNETGAILAIVGGRSIKHSLFNRATTAKRPIGSVFKPFVYTAAFNAGLMPGSLIDDGPLREGEIKSINAAWDPKNADRKSMGLQSASYGLIKSRNTMSVRVGNIAGLKSVIKTANNVGINIADEKISPQLFLGNLDCDLESLTSAYTVFPNNGSRVPAFTINYIEDRSGKVFYRAAAQSYPALPVAPCELTAKILERVVSTDGTGARARSLGFRKPAGGKTGTTNDFKDTWFVGFTDKVTCGVWAGLDEPKSIISGAYGSNVALPIWTRIMFACEKYGYPANEMISDATMAEITLCRTSGQLPGRNCKKSGNTYREKIPHDLVPMHLCHVHENQKITKRGKEKPNRLRVLKRLFQPN
ncbi:MAG: PBP1A family penicillin-binding protein [Verrucomicrobiaceae bacterium]|nr:MAG: PBP1A family penicillin-binding protein [Verrucomicrobiaceae bacterium]